MLISCCWWFTSLIYWWTANVWRLLIIEGTLNALGLSHYFILLQSKSLCMVIRFDHWLFRDASCTSLIVLNSTCTILRGLNHVWVVSRVEGHGCFLVGGKINALPMQKFVPWLRFIWQFSSLSSLFYTTFFALLLHLWSLQDTFLLTALQSRRFWLLLALLFRNFARNIGKGVCKGNYKVKTEKFLLLMILGHSRLENTRIGNCRSLLVLDWHDKV